VSAGPLAERLTAQLLAGPPASGPLGVTERLLAIQAQDLRGARLALRARARGLELADVDRALAEERSLVISWLNRGTLHLVRSEDYPWLQALMAPRLLTRSARRLAQEGLDAGAAERGLATIGRALAEDGPLRRSQLGERLTAAGVHNEGQALIHLLALSCLRGVAVRAPVLEGESAYVLVRDWLGEPDPVERGRALAELARRYLAGHGPAGEADLTKWSGLPLRDVRAGLAAIAAELDERPDGLLALRDAPPAAELPPPRLLGPFEPLLLGWALREPVLGEHAGRVVSGGILRAFALAGGRAVATWGMRAGEVRIDPFAPFDEAVAEALEGEADEVARFLAG
jgi:Winged helix DNA-binding domain